MEEKLNEKVEGVGQPSLERLKRVAEELNKTGVEESRKKSADFIEHPRQSRDLKENPEGKQASYPGSRAELTTGHSGAGEKTSNPESVTIERPTFQKGEMKTAGIALSDLIQEKMKLEKILQEMNNLKSKICQRIEIIKTIERREKELNQQLASLGEKDPNFLEEAKKKLDDLRKDILY